MIIPPHLKPGDLVALVPTARKISAMELEDGIALLHNWGLRSRSGQGTGRGYFQSAGTDAERAADLQAAIDDPEVKAIWCARGGYGTVRLMDRIDLSRLENDPKWIIGFSDITVLHNVLHNMGIASLHAQMPFNIGRKTEETRGSLRQALMADRAPDIQCALSRSDQNRPGIREGSLIGGNLSVLYSLRGTPCDIDPRGKILFLEDLDELLYHVDRMVQNLRLAGWFRDLAGLVVGGMSEMRNKNEQDPFGTTAEGIIAEVIAGTNYPVCFNFPAGHGDDNRAMIMGGKAKLSVTAEGATLSFG